jgi:hypothetical protein
MGLRARRRRLRACGLGAGPGGPLTAARRTIVLFTRPGPVYASKPSNRLEVVGATYVWGTLGLGSASMTAGPWVLPTTNADGSAIGTITGQTIYFDTVSRMGSGVAYAYSTPVGDGTSLSKVLTGLAASTVYYYALTVTVAGVESDLGIENYGTSA